MNNHYGDIYNIGDRIGALLTPPFAAPRRVAEDQLITLQRQFARPEGITAAYDVLEREHTVIVHGDPGSGRSSAARVLLCELPRDNGTYHELTPEQPEPGSSGRWLPLDLVGAHDRMLLDLSAAEEKTWHAVHKELSDFRHAVLRKGSFLVVVLPASHQLSPQFVHLKARIKRPDAIEALTRHLRLAAVDEDVRERAPAALRTYLRTLPPMRELARLAESIASLRGPGGFAAWCNEALAAQTDRTDDVAQLVPELKEGRERALLLTSALLNGARAEVVHRGTNLLVQEAGSAHDDRPLLEHRGLSDRLKVMGAELGTNARVRFTSPGFAGAARRYFWTNLPDVRDPLGKWMRTAVTLRDLEAADLGALVERFTDLCVQTRDYDRLTDLVERWTTDSARHSTEVRAAAHLLKRGVENEHSGNRFRAEIYDWSTRQVTGNLRQVLAEVCEKVMSIHHPEPALVRLHHLARHEPRPGVARTSLFRYVNQDSRLQRRLLARLATTQSPRHHRADADLFLDLAELPDTFLLTPSTREWLTICWRTAFNLLEPSRWAPCATHWLATADAVDDKALVDAALGILVDASDLRYPILSRVYANARRSVSSDLAAQLLGAINAAQRAGFTLRSPDLEASPS